MSIIHDALKKVQQTNPPAAQKKETVIPSVPGATAEPATGKENFNIPLFVAALCAVIAMIFAVLPHFAAKKTAIPAPAPLQASEPEAPARTTSTPSSIPIAEAITSAMALPGSAMTRPETGSLSQKIVDPNDPLSSIQIEGVIDMGGKKAVLINGNIYEEGQTIAGKIISEVTFTTLTIMDNGQKRTFPVKPQAL